MIETANYKTFADLGKNGVGDVADAVCWDGREGEQVLRRQTARRVVESAHAADARHHRRRVAASVLLLLARRPTAAARQRLLAAGRRLLGARVAFRLLVLV